MQIAIAVVVFIAASGDTACEDGKREGSCHRVRDSQDVESSSLLSVGTSTKIVVLDNRPEDAGLFSPNSKLNSVSQPALQFESGQFEPDLYTSFRNSNGQVIPFGKETDEHSFLVKYLQPTSAVFELGARYGSSSCVIAWLQNNSGRLVSVEGDSDVWPAQEDNMEAIGCKNMIWRGFVSRKAWKKKKTRNGSEWTTVFEVAVDGESDIPSITFFDLQRKAGMVFDTFLVDCEGCFDSWLEEFPDAVDKVSSILLEGDYGIGWQRQGYANYTRVTEFLTGKGFQLKEQKTVQNSEYALNGRIDFFVFIRTS